MSQEQRRRGSELEEKQPIPAADAHKRDSGLRHVLDQQGEGHGGAGAWMQPPGFEPTHDIDFISDQGGDDARATLNPRFLPNDQHNHNHNNSTLSYVSSVTHSS